MKKNDGELPLIFIPSMVNEISNEWPKERKLVCVILPK